MDTNIMLDKVTNEIVKETHTRLAEAFKEHGNQTFTGNEVADFILAVRDKFLKGD